MKVKISWRNCVKHGQAYMDPKDCPLYHALKELGLETVVAAGWIIVSSNGKLYKYDGDLEPEVHLQPGKRRRPKCWNSYTVNWCIRRHRGFVVEIPGLENELETKASRGDKK